MYKIRCFADFGTSEVIQKELEQKGINFLQQEREHYGTQYIFTNREDYTHVILFNKAMPNISHIPKENVIGFAHEPLQFLNITYAFVEYARKYIHRYYIGDKGNLPEPFIEGYGFLLCYSPAPKIEIPRQKFMSIMISQKTNAPGHQYRHQLVQNILRTNLPIDIYGRGCMYYSGIQDERIKGTFDNNELFEGYRFTISIENFQCNHYFSEKIVNPLLQKVTPIYLGCYHISDYFPEMYLSLSGDLSKDMILLQNIYENPEKYICTIDLKKVDDKVNLLANLPNLFP
jgi:hypothetical protein